MRHQPFSILQQYMVGEIKVDTKEQLNRTYMRLLLDAFVPYQEAMLASLDELMAKHEMTLTPEGENKGISALFSPSGRRCLFLLILLPSGQANTNLAI